MPEAAFGNGQMDPSDTSSDFTALSFVIQQALARVRTMIVVQVKSVTNDGGISPAGFVSVQPLVNMLDGAGISTPHGTIYNLPYTRIQGGTNAIIIDPQIGDIGWAAIADRDISAVKASKSVSNPGSFRRFDLADGVYIGGILNGTPVQHIQFTSTGITVMSPTQIKISAPAILLDGAVTTTGKVNGVNLATHIHSGVVAGGADSGPPVP